MNLPNGSVKRYLNTLEKLFPNDLEQVKETIKNTYLTFVPSLTSINELRRTSIPINFPLSPAVVDALQIISSFLNTSNIQDTVLRKVFMIIGALLGDGWKDNCALTLHYTESQLRDEIILFMESIAKKKDCQWYSVKYSKKLENGEWEYRKMNYGGGKVQYSEEEKEKLINQWIQEGFAPACFDIHFPHTLFNNLMKELGFYVHDQTKGKLIKTIPSFVYELPMKYASPLLNGAIYSDGHMSPSHQRRMSFTQVDQIIMNAVMFLGMICGYHVSGVPKWYEDEEVIYNESYFTGYAILGFGAPELEKKQYPQGKTPPQSVRARVELIAEVEEPQELYHFTFLKDQVDTIHTANGLVLVLGQNFYQSLNVGDHHVLSYSSCENDYLQVLPESIQKVIHAVDYLKGRAETTESPKIVITTPSSKKSGGGDDSPQKLPDNIQPNIEKKVALSFSSSSKKKKKKTLITDSDEDVIVTTASSSSNPSKRGNTVVRLEQDKKKKKTLITDSDDDVIVTTASSSSSNKESRFGKNTSSSVAQSSSSKKNKNVTPLTSSSKRDRAVKQDTGLSSSSSKIANSSEKSLSSSNKNVHSSYLPSRNPILKGNHEKSNPSKRGNTVVRLEQDKKKRRKTLITDSDDDEQ
ncbi:hypothetical protein C9374_005526 [Naegleria lovaniensis]|uniref:DOD-type homing endonuclease domain-containing protein n=1 Tax=Naegleria lovaniensis TaxID=51637 RepID=A0AA88KI00_NAELO|nr:uncharacterized protein C9374_005526 [Naegleria lovaniensis]KAG2382324.1 hypothetical protein C9374_005526 [Naegleria lovaniensis]